MTSHASAPPALQAHDTESERCPVCGGHVVADGAVADDRYGYPGTFSLYRCSACGHQSLAVEMSSQQLSDLYTTYYPRSSFDVESWSPPKTESALRTWWRGLRASAFRWVPRNVRVLDIGCGFGESLGYHRNRGCDAHGVEADANILRVARLHGLQVRVGLFDANAYEPGSFDVVTLDQVMEHVNDPVAVLRGVAQVLTQDGMAVLSTPNAQGWGARLFGRRWIHWHAPYHVQFFSLESMQQAAKASGLRLEAAHTITNSAWLGFQWCHLLSPVAEGRPSAFWSPSAPRSRWHQLGFRVASLLDRLGINALLTRLFDAMGIGDNRVFVLRKPAAK